MAKIVPKGYADIGAYDEQDSFFTLLEYIDRYGAAKRNVEEKRDANLSNSFETILNAVNTGAIDTALEFDKFQGQYNSLMDNVNRSGNPAIKLGYETLGSVMDSERSSVEIFEKGFESISNVMSDSSNLMNKKSDVWNYEYINGLDAQGISALVADLDTMAAQVGYDPTNGKIAKYKGYTKNGVNVAQIEDQLNFGYNRLKNVEETLRGKGKLTQEEWKFIASNPTNKELDAVRNNVKETSLNLYNDATAQTRHYNKLLDMLDVDSNNSIYKIIEEGKASGITGMGEMEDMAFGMTGDVGLFNSFLAKTPNYIAGKGAIVKSKKKRLRELEMKANNNTITQAELDEYRSNPITPAEESILVFSDMYDDLIEGIQEKHTEQTELRMQMRDKYNFWSEVPLDIDIAEKTFEKNKVKEDETLDTAGSATEAISTDYKIKKLIEEQESKESKKEEKKTSFVMPKSEMVAEKIKNSQIVQNISREIPKNVIDVVVGNSKSSTLSGLITSMGANSTMALMLDAWKLMTWEGEEVGTVQPSASQPSQTPVATDIDLDTFAQGINSSQDARRMLGGFQANALYLAAKNYKKNPNANTKKKLEYFYQKYLKK